MPGGDRTGPWGLGPMTGRAAGYCAGFGAPGYANFAPGMRGGRGFSGRGGRGGGRGWRNWYHATGLPGWARAGWNMASWGPGYAPPPEYHPESELDTLKAQADYYHEALEDIARRIEQLDKAAERERKE